MGQIGTGLVLRQASLAVFDRNLGFPVWPQGKQDTKIEARTRLRSQEPSSFLAQLNGKMYDFTIEV
jgi:hypothetical protein